MDRSNAQTILRYGAVPAFLRPMPFQKIRNLGGKLGTAVKETYEANTVGDLLYVQGGTLFHELCSFLRWCSGGRAALDRRCAPGGIDGPCLQQ